MARKTGAEPRIFMGEKGTMLHYILQNLNFEKGKIISNHSRSKFDQNGKTEMIRMEAKNIISPF